MRIPQIYLESSVLHDISETKDHILPLFESLREYEVKKLKNHYHVDEFIDEFRRVGSFQTMLEQVESADVARDNRAIDGLG